MEVKVFKNKKRSFGALIELKKHSITINVTVLIVVGLILGTILYQLNNSFSSIIIEYFKRYYNLIKSNGFVLSFTNNLINNILIDIFIFVFGLCAIGSPIVCVVPLIKGTGIGVVVKYLYQTYGLKGFLYCILVFFPAEIISLLAIIIAENESFSFSKSIYNSIKNKSMESDYKLYIQRYIFVIILSVISAFISASLNTLLYGKLLS